MKELPLLGYAPDDPQTAGFFSSGSGYEFTRRGMLIERAMTQAASGSVTGAVTDGLYAIAASGTGYIHVAAPQHLYRIASTSVTNADRGGAYTAGGQWSFFTWGDHIFATNLLDVVQCRKMTGTTAFVDSNTAATDYASMTNIPKAQIGVQWGPPGLPMVMLLNYNDGAAHPSGFWNSDEGGPLLPWTPDISRGTYAQDLLGAGPLTAGIGFRDSILIWSANQMFIGSWNGPGLQIPVTMRRVANNIGCVGIYARTTLSDVCYFLGKQGLFYFDGSYPRKLEQANGALLPVQDYLIRWIAANPTWAPYTQLVNNGSNRITINLRNPAGIVPSVQLSIDMLSRRVGQYVAQQPKYGVLDNAYSFSYDGKVYSEASTPSSTGAFWRFNPIGNYEQDTTVGRMQYRFVDQVNSPPLAMAMSHTASADADPQPIFGAPNTGANAPAVNASPWRSDALAAGKWHVIQVTMTGNTSGKDPELVSVSTDMLASGKT